VMSHELRTPLNAIGGYAELMELGIHGPVSKGQLDTLDRIQRSQRLLLGLINQVLNYARIETGNIRYHVTSVAVNDMLRAAELPVLPQLRAKDLKFTCNCPPTDARVTADEEKLQQIILNLLANAIKFTEHGGSIELSAVVEPAHVFFRVRDTGIGISSDKLAAIFDPFVQIDPNYTRTSEGVGLGLAISRDLARGMDGDLFAESKEGEGSVFTLRRPRAADA
jgi:signal transduction histidine kinase